MTKPGYTDSSPINYPKSKISHEVFKKSLQDRVALAICKEESKRNRREQYGKDWKKYINSDKCNESVVNERVAA